jgi:anaerobic dimethyl sulfoxide reductase subunit C (anchor subunit)
MSIQWELVFFTLFAGVGCGTFVGSVALTEWCGRAKQVRFTSMIVVLVTLGIGGISSILHLGHPERLFAALGNPTSGIFMESAMMGLLGLNIIVYLVALRRNAADRTRKFIATVGTVPAVILTFANGYSYVLAARPAWDTLIVPLLYMASATVIGCFSLSVLIAHAENSDTTATAAINRAKLTALAIQAVLLIAYLVHLAVAPYSDVTRSVTRVLAGDLALLFWGGLVLPGFLVPIALMTQIDTKKAEAAARYEVNPQDALKIQIHTEKAKRISPLSLDMVGLACVLVAGVAFRVLMFSLGSSIKQYF